MRLRFPFLYRLWRGLATPVVTEWSFMLLFVVGISFSTLYLFPQDLFYQGLHWLDLRHSFRAIAIAYLFATLIHYTGWQWLKLPFYCVSLVFFALQSFLIVHFGLLLDPKVVTLLLETTGQETHEFWSEYLWAPKSVLCYVLTLTFVVEICWVERRKWRKRKEGGAMPDTSSRLCRYRDVSRPQRVRRLFSSLGSVILSGIIAVGLTQTHVIPRFLYAKAISDLGSMAVYGSDGPTALLYSYRYVQLSSAMIQPALEHTWAVQDVRRLVEEPLTVIMVVGESYIKYHTPLYGYQRDTSPRLCREQCEGRLWTFDNVIATHNYTSESLRNVYSLNALARGEAWYDAPFFPYLFRQAGFDVYAWDNQYDRQQRSNHALNMSAYLYAPQFEQRVYTRLGGETFAYDEELIDDYQQHVTLPPDANSLVIFHLYGQHVPAEERYPQTAEWHHFTAEQYATYYPQYSHEAHKRLAHYDNATRYNDYVLGRILDLYKDRNTVVVYFSDHGEEMYDYRDSFGRINAARDQVPQWLKYQFDVPFMIWCSDRYQELYPEIMERIRAAVHAPFMLDVVGDILLDLAQIESSAIRPEVNPLSSHFHPSPRIVRGNVQGAWSYDELRPTIN